MDNITSKERRKPVGAAYTGFQLAPNNSVINHTGISNSFLSFSPKGLKSGKTEAILKRFNIVKFAEDIATEMQAITKHDQSFIYQHTGTLSTVELDQLLLRKCVTSLIDNAIKCSGEHTFIEFDTEVNDIYVSIIIKHNGVNNTCCDLEHFSNRFLKAHGFASISDITLDLNMVTYYTRLMNGRIKFENKDDCGTSCTISFPVQ